MSKEDRVQHPPRPGVEVKTSEEWYKELGKDYIIYDPDGWDRRNYDRRRTQ